jgi:hypothetical protein
MAAAARGGQRIARLSVAPPKEILVASGKPVLRCTVMPLYKNPPPERDFRLGQLRL